MGAPWPARGRQSKAGAAWWQRRPTLTLEHATTTHWPPCARHHPGECRGRPRYAGDRDV